jgi:hypothetical protein
MAGEPEAGYRKLHRGSHPRAPVNEQPATACDAIVHVVGDGLFSDTT